MAKIRVHQLAKELGIDSKMVIEEAEKHGIRVKNHMSSLNPADEMMLRAFLETLRPPPAPVAEPPSAPKPVPPGFGPPSSPPKSDGPRVVQAPSPSADADEGETRTRPIVRVSEVAARRAERGGPPPRVVRVGIPRREDEEDDDATPQEETPSVAAEKPARPVPGVVAGAPPVEKKARPEAPELTARPPQSVQAVRSATARPAKPEEDLLVTREPSHQRRQAKILGRKELPPRKPAGAGGPRGRGQGGPGGPGGPGGAGGGQGGGLIATRSSGNKRTFLVTGRGRGPNRGGGPGRRGPGTQGGGGRGRGRMSRDNMPGGRGRRRQETQVEVPSELTVPLPITLKGLSERLGVKANLLIQKLLVNHKQIVRINDSLSAETVELLGLEFECVITTVEKEDIETKVLDQLDSGWESEDDNVEVRAPLVSFLGHVDHGKTSLLDAIRSTRVASREHGGITQHIGASHVELDDGRSIVLLDTPGHQAFSEMRARGAQLTDIVVLVVAADDGVMPQTQEAIAHAKAADVPVIVALNKVDKPGADTTKVRTQLASAGLQDEAWGGDTMVIETSAINGDGISDLLEAILLNAEVLELTADPTRPAMGTVVEAEQTRGEGIVARLIVTDGTLRKGDVFVCGSAHGRIRAIRGPHGDFIEEAGPATPVVIPGLTELPTAGDKLYVLQDLNQAKEISQKRMALARERDRATKKHVSLDSLFEKLGSDVLKIILKTDVTGSLEVLKREIAGLTHPEIRPEIIHSAVGSITETDVTLADASDAIILGFHVIADSGVRRLADEKGVEIRTYQVIYKLMDELRDAMEGRLAPDEKEVILGEAEIRQTWKVSRLGVIAGCFIQSGLFRRSARVRVSRDGVVIKDNAGLSSLKRFKDDVREVKEGFECGMLVDGFDGVQVGDVITCYEIQYVKRTLEDAAKEAAAREAEKAKEDEED